MIRRRQSGASVWAWAVEWNQSFRVVGFFGDEAEARALSDWLPMPKESWMQTGSGEWISARIEEALLAEEDDLFTLPPVGLDTSSAAPASGIAE